MPSDQLTAVTTSLGERGDVVSSSRSAEDVTATAIDLGAWVDATRTSVERLTELMAQSGSAADHLQAETTLSKWQAQLESYEQQLVDLESRVSMSSVQIDFSLVQSVADPEPAGFGDRVLNGWNGLIASLNALVVLLGFLPPGSPSPREFVSTGTPSLSDEFSPSCAWERHGMRDTTAPARGLARPG